MKDKILVLAGPTAVGKTSLSIELAKELNGEIISTDSMQIYKYMDIGSAKVTEDEMDGIKHHMIDIITPDTEFSVADYKQLASKIISDILSRGKVPILTGGTGLYINALTCKMDFTESEKNKEYRRELENIAEVKGNEYVHNILKEIDPISAEKIHYNNSKRVIRAIEVYKTTGKTFSSFDLGDDIYESEYDVKYFVLTRERQELYNRINERVDIMLKHGLVEECKNLLRQGYNLELQAMQGIGYKEIISYLYGEITYEEAVNKIKQGSRNYAKRQLTWFRRDKRAIFLDLSEMSDKEAFNTIIKDIITI